MSFLHWLTGLASDEAWQSDSQDGRDLGDGLGGSRRGGLRDVLATDGYVWLTVLRESISTTENCHAHGLLTLTSFRFHAH